MKKTICILSLFLLMQMSVLGADGDVFTSTLENGVIMTFKVISETEKTCQVGRGGYYYYNGSHSSYPAIDKSITGDIIVPSIIEGYKVIEISSTAFENCSFSSITIPKGVTLIGTDAFHSCKNLSSVKLSEDIKILDAYAFDYCKNLTSITLPEGLQTIGSYAFSSCGITSISLPRSLESLGSGVFDFTGVTSLTIPENVTHLGSLFEEKSPIISAIFHCKNILWSSSGRYTRNTSSSLKEVILENEVQTIYDRTFTGLKSLERVVISNGVKTIGEFAFSGCSSITSMVIPQSVNSIGRGVFANCNISNITVDAGNETYDSRECCNAIIETKSNEMKAGCINTFIPEGVTSIGPSAFYGVGMTSIDIPSSVRIIGQSAFYNCVNLTELTIPNKVTNIGDGAFNGCVGLTSISIPNSVTTIGREAFNGCSNINHLVVPTGVQTLGYRSFYDCSRLRYIVLPSTIQDIGFEAFYDCNDLIFVISKMKEPPSGLGAFNTAYVKYFTLYVPKGTKEAYSKKFGEFGEIIEKEDLGDDNPTCFKPVAEYDGRNLSLTSNRGSTIYYTTDGSEPTVNSERYVSPIAISDLCTIKAIAMMDGMLDSNVLDYSIPYCFGDDAVHIVEPGKLNDALEAYHQTGKEKLTVHGKINAADVNAIRQMPALRELDLQDLSFEDGIMPDEFLSNLNMVVCRVQLASDVITIGKLLFKGCNRLAAIVWNGRIPTSGALAETGNPNLLLYVKQANDAPYAVADGINNIVVNGNAQTITLRDNPTGNANFCCPESFTAAQIQYTHNYSMTTGYDECRGWETLSLPFDVQTVEHETKGILTPIVVNDQNKAPFWLCELTESGFKATDKINANQPYIISMPNNMTYSNEYILKGNVTFGAKDAIVKATELVRSRHGSKIFVPNFERRQQSTDIYVLNVNEAYGGYLEGSVFVQDVFPTKPFGAYMTTDGSSAHEFIPIFEGSTPTDIHDIMHKGETNNETWHSLDGRLLMLKPTTKGLYIHNGKKMVVK